MSGPDRVAPPHPLGRRVAGLDGLRAVAVAFVFVCHVAPGRFPSGFVGVDLFFVLSGYLITSLLLQEFARDGRIYVVAFYVRRARRLFPALVTMVLLVSAFWWVRGTPRALDAVAALTYLTDAWAPLTRSLAGPFTHTWSLAVEEQFYLVWPALLVLSLRRRVPPAFTVVTLALVAAVAVVPALLHFTAADLYFSPLPHVCELGAGVLVALWLRDGRRPRALVHPAPAALVVVGFAAVLTQTVPWSWWLAGGFAVLGAASTLVVGHLVVAEDSPVSRALSAAPLRWLGLRSYGFYLWHYPVLLWLYGEVADPVLRGAIGLVVSLALTAASWRFVELPFLRAGHRPPRHARRTPVAAGRAPAVRVVVGLDREPT